MKKVKLHVLAEIGKGTFGKIYKCINKSTNKAFALKIENTIAKGVQGQIKTECDIYKEFENEFIAENIPWPRIYQFGAKSSIKGQNLLVMDLYGSNLDTILKANVTLPGQTVAYIATKMIKLISIFHSKGYIHRDIKPQNFVIDVLQKPNIQTQIYLIDYGLAKKFSSKFNQAVSLKGTVRYTSINTHLGTDQYRRDDLQSILHMLIYFLVGNLPWQNLMDSCKTKQEGYKAIMIKKMSTRIEDVLTDTLKEPILYFWIYVLNLSFDEIPDYVYLESLFTKAAKGFTNFSY